MTVPLQLHPPDRRAALLSQRAQVEAELAELEAATQRAEQAQAAQPDRIAYTVPEAAALCDVSPRTFKRWEEHGLRIRRPPVGDPLVMREDIEEWLKQW